MKKEKITTARPDIYELEPIVDEWHGFKWKAFLLGVMVGLAVFSYWLFMQR